MWRRIAIVAGLVALSPIIVVPLWIASLDADLDTPGDADLDVRQVELPPGANGWTHIELAARFLDWPESGDPDDMLQAVHDGERWDAAWVADRVGRNAEAFAELERALAAPAVAIPERDADDVFDGPLMALSRFGKLAGAEARLLLEREQAEAALERSLLGLRLGRKLGGASGVRLLEIMVATTTQQIGVSALDPIVRRMVLSPERARALARGLDSYRLPAQSWHDAWAGEYQWAKQMLEDLDAGSRAGGNIVEILSIDERNVEALFAALLPRDLMWQPNRTLASYAAYYRELQAAARAPCAAFEPYQRGQAVLTVLSGNAIGKVLFDISMTKMERFDAKRCGIASNISLAQVTIASKAWWDRHGSLPHRLDDLVPNYLDAVPRDGYDGEPLRYSRDKRRAWSIGEDLVDSGGSDERRDRSEPTVSLDFARR